MIRRIRLVTGLTLFVLVTIHLVNHSIGLVSLAALNRAEATIMYYFQVGPQDTIVLVCFLVHLLLAFQALWMRRSWRMPPWEAAQLLLGLCIPLLIAEHFATTRGMFNRFGIDMNYPEVLHAYWTLRPELGVYQILLLTVAWTHGCIGVHSWLRLKPGYERWRLTLYTAAILLPVFALLGFLQATRELQWLAAQPGWLEANSRIARVLQNDGLSLGSAEAAQYRWLFLGLLGATLAGRAVKLATERRRGLVRLYYPDGRRVVLPPGGTVLEASRAAGIPHAAVCGGRARCSTCRVRVGKGSERLPPPGDSEARVLARIGAPSVIRLACQIRPTAHLEVTPLLPPNAGPRDGFGGMTHLLGDEREVAILFADLRGFTNLASNRLPFDVVFVLNRYFAEMGEAVITAGGRVDKFIGDGVMALFGIEEGPAEGCRRALEAARAMGQRMDKLNAALAHDLKSPLRIGVGIHVGPAIVGEMGYGSVRSVTAIGDAVNVASRLEPLTKQYGAELVISAEVARQAGLPTDTLRRESAEVRGKDGPVAILVADSLTALPVLAAGG